MFKDKLFVRLFIIFVVLQLFLTGYMFFQHRTVPFDNVAYQYYSHHYVPDARIQGGDFSFLRALGVWDAQWYLRIADDGYPTKTVFDANQSPWFMGALTYAFFPLYPLLIAGLNFLIRNVELSAYLLGTMLLLANFISLYYVVSKLFTRALAAKTLFLLFLFPFGIFYRSYYTESLFLLLLIWLSYFMIRRNFFYTALIAALLFVCRPNGLIIGGVFFFTLALAVYKKRIGSRRAMSYVALSFVPFLGWLAFCYFQTGDPLYWQHIQAVWYKGDTMASAINHNIEQVFKFFSLPFHHSRESQVDTAMMVVVGGLLLASRTYFKKYPQLWWIALIIWLFPLLVKDTMSFSRFQSVSFPLFIFLAARINGWKYYMLCVVFFGLLLYVSLHFVNWRWIG